MTTPITRLDIEPSYRFGFSFAWSMAGDFADPAPWTFVVQESLNTQDDWRDISPVLPTVYRWNETEKRLINKDSVIFFRIKLTTPVGTYTSAPVTPGDTLNRREYLLIKDIMRREVLHAKTLAGILGELWVRNVYGPKCPVCVDPITGNVRSSQCPTCQGTGYVPAYHGPYETWMTFSPSTGKTVMDGDGSGVVQPRPFLVRTIGTPPIRHGDFLVDKGQDKRYVVDSSNMVAEIRRIPVVQAVTVAEAATSEAIFTVRSE